jgi:hypothetical protein
MTAPTQARSYNYQAIEDAWTKGKIAVLDSMPGSGKTTAVTNYLRNKELDYVIFVSPFKSEVEQELPNRKLAGLNYVHPESGKGGKVTQLKELITRGDKSSGNRLHRITCTHSAFTRLTSEAFNQLEHYTLIIDETLDVINKLEDVRLYSEHLLLSTGSVNEINKLYQFTDPTWFDASYKKDVDGFATNGSGNKDSMFKLCQMAAQNQLYQYSESNWFQMLPIELLTKAKHVIVMTHGFENSFMHCWLKLHNVQHHYIDNDKLGLASESKLKQQLKSNLTFIEPTRAFNDLADGRRHESLSISHWQQIDQSNQLKAIGSSINHLVKEKLKADKDDIFWTCPKAYKQKIEAHAPKLRGKITLQQPLELADVNEDFIDKSDLKEIDEQHGTTHSSWLPCNIKARNDFGHITNCLYAFSLNPPPSLVILLSGTSGIELEKIKATFKLNNLLQFIYRGSIREKQPMNLCIIPADTRALLDDFLKHY